MKLKTNAALERREEPKTLRPKLRLAAATFSAVRSPERLDGFGARPAIKRSKEAQTKQRIQDAFAEKFEGLAKDPEKFHQMMKTVYGEKYDKSAAEGLRQRALKGDTSWLPEIRFVDPSTLQGGNGAYDKDGDVVYLNNQLDMDTAIQTYVEEAGHALDTKLNKTDAAGDEGELLRRLMGGEQLSAAQIRDIKAENDKGVITVDGRQIEVEFWKPFKKLKKALKKVGSAIKNAAKKVGSAVKKVAVGVGKTVFGVLEGVSKGIGGFFKGVFTGKPLEGVRDLFKGLDKGLLRAPMHLAKGVFGGAKDLLDGVTGLLPKPIAKPINWFGTRVLSVGNSIVKGALGIARTAMWAVVDTASKFAGTMWNALKKLSRGDFKGFIKDFGKSFYRAGKRLVGGVFDILARTLALVGTVGGTLIGVESPGQSLTKEQKAQLKEIYGESLDLDLIDIKKGGLAAVGSNRTVGNTIYLKKDKFNADGTLNASGMRTLIHELGHVWQNQNGSTAYLHEALLAQAGAAIKDGDSEFAYRWRDDVVDGIDFAGLNPEEQAEILSIYTEILMRGDAIVEGADFNVGTDHRGQLTAKEAAYIRKAGLSIRKGEGAP